MVVKVTARYTDTELKRGMRIGETFDVSDERGELLIRRKVATKICDSAKPEKKPGPGRPPKQETEKAEEPKK